MNPLLGAHRAEGALPRHPEGPLGDLGGSCPPWKGEASGRFRLPEGLRPAAPQMDFRVRIKALGSTQYECLAGPVKGETLELQGSASVAKASSFPPFSARRRSNPRATSTEGTTLEIGWRMNLLARPAPPAPLRSRRTAPGHHRGGRLMDAAVAALGARSFSSAGFQHPVNQTLSARSRGRGEVYCPRVGGRGRRAGGRRAAPLGRYWFKRRVLCCPRRGGKQTPAALRDGPSACRCLRGWGVRSKPREGCGGLSRALAQVGFSLWCCSVSIIPPGPFVHHPPLAPLLPQSRS